MGTYRAGQRVRIEGPESVVIEATVREFNGHPRVTIPGMGVIRLDGASPWGSGSTVIVLAEPRPDEPTGLGAVVRDDFGGLWVRTYQVAAGASTTHPPPWREVLMGGYAESDATTRRWTQIHATVVLSEGV